MSDIDHLSYIRIRGLEDSDTEVFQGSGASSGAPGNTGTLPEKEAAYDLGTVWAAQKKFTATLIAYLNKLDPGQNGDWESILSDYVNVLNAANGLASSTTAYDLSTKAVAELPIIWQTIDRQPSKEMATWTQDAETFAGTLENWYKTAVKARHDYDDATDALEVAQQQLADAETQAEIDAANAAIIAAQTKVDAANAEMTAAANAGDDSGRGLTRDPGLPVDSTFGKLVAIGVLARALATGNVMLIGVTLIRIFVPVIIDLGVDWLMKKLPGSKKQDLVPVVKEMERMVTALEALKYNDEEIDFGAFRAYLRSKIIES
jgi:hypothetical protein